ncbi:AMP-binding protein [Streptomyces sp. NPDC097610]|uniref:AMP-binding protein n=1 Tax=Streptomyces sp. NPDC097610 TaxID=3157227 RepID=UPI003319A745
MAGFIDPLVIDGYLVRSAERSPERLAVCDRTRRLTYAEFDEQLTRFARALSGLGVRYGDRVAMLMDNSIENAVCLFGAPRLGAVAAPINGRLTAAEVAYIVGDLEPVVVVADASHLSQLEQVDAAAGVKAVVVVGGEPDVDVARLPVPALAYEDFLGSASTERLTVDIDARDPAFILYTSGTTGRPKGAVLGHAGYVTGTLTTLHTMRMFDPGEVRHVAVPMFHSGGLNSILQQLVLGGPSLITEPGGLAAEALLDLWEEHGVATAFLTPTQWAQICDVPDVRSRNLKLSRLIWGSSKPPVSFVQRLQETFPGKPVFANFGMTETSGNTCSLLPEYALSKSQTVGRPVPHMQVRVVDSEMRDLPPGEPGEIVYQGPSVLREYWRNPKATAEAFTGGWFHSGDIGVFDEDGFLSVVDRLKDMIISAGENIYVSEVEAALASHPKVAQVVVVGVPHPKWIESPRAVVVPSDPADPPTLEELQAHVRPLLASYKKPTSLSVVSEVPRNTMGKILRTKVKHAQLLQDGVRS